eukprot:TRINITY_DN17517_c0_g1_i1.p1 TRINITY_DN17517_c0_g1~~TRINITY_DN17517_c0_g1_i1.p1  ORF type:complete len:318 (+),score=58.97 TRINITY_DN17517_c0_g1_i1:34-954(+)
MEAEDEPVLVHVLEAVLPHVVKHDMCALSLASKACLRKIEQHCRGMCYDRFSAAAEREEASESGKVCRWRLLLENLLKLRRFDEELVFRTSVKVEGAVVEKIDDERDSDNVFVRGRVLPGEELFVEFRVECSTDECSVGVTPEVGKLARTSGWRNLSFNCSWIYSKRKSMPAFLCGGTRINPIGETGIKAGDRIAVFVSEPKRQVSWFKNGAFVFTNLPEHPLSPPALGSYGIYCMVDRAGDRISIVNFGTGLPYAHPPVATLAEVDSMGSDSDCNLSEDDSSDSVFADSSEDNNLNSQVMLNTQS